MTRPTRRTILAAGAALSSGALVAACGAGGSAGGASGGAAGGAIKPETGTLAWHLWSAQPEHLEQYNDMAKTFQAQNASSSPPGFASAPPPSAGGEQIRPIDVDQLALDQ